MQVLKQLIAAWLALAFLVGRAAAQEEPSLTAGQVQMAIRQGREYLLNEQSARGTWDDMAQYPGGVTALCTLALLNAGVPPNDPKIDKALSYLRSLELNKTYTVSLQTMALCAATPRRDMKFPAT